ncbi:MAG TPA: hypothetical protein VD789_03205 [Thermomicrobiales bacterium]|nr:hypothetical protein [Thermomicrobiales bacterium]
MSVPRDCVGGVRLDDGKLVVDAKDARGLLTTAFLRFGYPWHVQNCRHRWH